MTILDMRAAGLAFCLAVGFLATTGVGEAQAPVKVHRIAVLCPWVCPTPRGERLSPPMSQKNPDDLMADKAFRLGLRDLGWVVDKILKGAKPGELPMEQPMRFEMAVNLATAKTLGLVIPQSIVVRADRLIR